MVQTRWALIVCFILLLAVGCNSPSTGVLIGAWKSDSGIVFAFDGENFTWVNPDGSVLRGTYVATDKTVTTYLGGVATKYQYMVEGELLGIKDNKGNGLLLNKTGEQKTTRSDSATPAAALDISGIWANSAMTITFNPDKTVVWAHPTGTITGTYTATGSSLTITTAKGPYSYALAVSGSQMILTDQQGGRIALVRSTGEPAETATDSPQSFTASQNMWTNNGVFYFSYPSGWSVKVNPWCDSMSGMCGKEYLLLDPQGKRVNFYNKIYAAPNTEAGAAYILGEMKDQLSGYQTSEYVQLNQSLGGRGAANYIMVGALEDASEGVYARLSVVQYDTMLVGYLLEIMASRETLQSYKQEFYNTLNDVQANFAENPSLKAQLIGKWHGEFSSGDSVSDRYLDLLADDRFTLTVDIGFSHTEYDQYGDWSSLTAGLGNGNSIGNYKVIGNTLFLFYTAEDNQKRIDTINIEEIDSESFLSGRTIYYRA